MSNENNGQTVSLKARLDEKLGEFLVKLEAEYDNFHLRDIPVDKSVAQYLKLNEGEIEKMTPSELEMAELKLNTYCFCIQQTTNRAEAIKNWAQRKLALIVSSKYESYNQFWKYDVIEKSIIRMDDAAKRCNEIIEESQMKIDEFAYLSQAVQRVANSYGKMSRRGSA